MNKVTRAIATRVDALPFSNPTKEKIAFAVGFTAGLVVVTGVVYAASTALSKKFPNV